MAHQTIKLKYYPHRVFNRVERKSATSGSAVVIFIMMVIYGFSRRALGV